MKKYCLFLVFTSLFISCSDTGDEHFEKGFALEKANNYTGALREYNLSINLNCNYKEVYFFRGRLKAKLLDYKGSIVDFNKSIELKILLPTSYLYRGISKYEILEFSGACSDWRSAVELGDTTAMELALVKCLN